MDSDDNYTSERKCCFCFKPVIGMRIFSVVTVLKTIMLYVVAYGKPTMMVAFTPYLIESILMCLWLIKDTKQTRYYLLIAAKIELVCCIIICLVLILIAILAMS